MRAVGALDDVKWRTAMRRVNALSRHRNVQRRISSDYISKQICEDGSFYQWWRYLDIDNSPIIAPEMLRMIGMKKFPALEVVDPFGLNCFVVRHSLNKKYRWELTEFIPDHIFDYQNDLAKLRVSYLHDVVHDFRESVGQHNHFVGGRQSYRRWLRYCAGNDFEKASTVEYASMVNGEEIHKHSKKANRNDLMKEPKPQRKKKKKTNRRDFSSVPEGEPATEAAMAELKLHVIYRVTTNDFDRRVDNYAVERTIKDRRKKLRERFVKRCNLKKVYLAFDHQVMGISPIATDESECEAIFEEESSSSCHFSEDKHQSTFDPVVIVSSSKNRNRRQTKKVGHSAENHDEYLKFFHSSPCEKGSSHEIATDEQLSISPPDNVSDDVGYASDTPTKLSPLPHIILPLPMQTTLANYVFTRFESAVVVPRLLPETFVVVLRDEVVVELGGRRFTGTIAIRDGPTQSVRWALNCERAEADEPPNCDSSVAGVSSRKMRTLFSSAMLIPEKVVAKVEPVVEDQCRRSVVYEALTAINEAIPLGKAPCNSVCNACFGNDCDGFALHCGHFFCDECWIENARTSLSRVFVPIQCMSFGCKAAVELDQARTFLVERECVRYEQLLWNKHLLREGYVYCDRCSSLLRRIPTRRPSAATIIICNCGAAKCLQCKNTAHLPMPCNLAQEYTDILERNGEELLKTSDRSTLKLRRCPACKNCCIRTDGCNHMLCTCGFQFCYACGEPFEDGTHYGCEKVVLQSVPLFDVIGGSTLNQDLQFMFEQNWHYREMRTAPAVAAFRKKLVRLGLAKYISSADVFFAAVELLERSEVTLHFLKKARGALRTNGLKRRRGTKKHVEPPTIRELFLVNYVWRLKFIINFFTDAVQGNERLKEERLLSLTASTERIAKSFLGR